MSHDLQRQASLIWILSTGCVENCKSHLKKELEPRELVTDCEGPGSKIHADTSKCSGKMPGDLWLLYSDWVAVYALEVHLGGRGIALCPALFLPLEILSPSFASFLVSYPSVP